MKKLHVINVCTGIKLHLNGTVGHHPVKYTCNVMHMEYQIGYQILAQFDLNKSEIGRS